MNFSHIFFLTAFLFIPISAQNWMYKFSFTKNINSQMSIECENNDQIWIGWSHYGTRSANSNIQLSAFPNEHDCWMNFTEKIAEQCNGSPQCDLSSQPTYIHKCGKISDYLYVAYKCIKEIETFDICKPIKRVLRHYEMQNENKNIYIKSSEFPVEYSSSLDCSCLISSNQQQNLKWEFLWFSLQDNDYLNIFNKNLSGWINPTFEMPISSKTNLIRFMTDDSLAYKGFWLKLSTRRTCKDDWQLVGDSCVKVFNEQLDWRSANQKCTQMNGNLLKIEDVVADLKMTQYMKSFYSEISSYWLGLRKYVDQHNQEKWMWSGNTTLYNDISWWPWRKSTNQPSDSYSTSNCVVKRKNEDGYFTTSCDPTTKNSFICQTGSILPSNSNSEITLQCGNTEEIRDEFKKFEKLNSKKEVKLTIIEPKIADDSSSNQISINSINNIVLPSFSKSPKTERVLNNNLNLDNINEYSKTTDSSKKPFKLEDNKPVVFSTVSSSSILLRQQNEPKLNTAILAGVVSGIGLVILIINIGVLFMCRRNIKKLLKSTKDSPREDMIQEYFEAFNTLHNSKTLRGTLGPNVLKTENILNIPQLQQQLRTNSSSAGTEDSLLHETAQLFYNPQFNRDLTLRQSSAFKPFNRDQDNNLLQIQNQNIMDLQRQLLINQQRLNTNQYDKMSHQPVKNSKNLIQNDSTGQYAHTYESLDTLEMPNRRCAAVHLGITSRNYRTILNSTNDSNLLQSPNSTEVTDAGNFNLSSSSSSTSSASTSTHQFPKQNQHIEFRLVDNMNQVQHNIPQLTQAQLANFLASQQGYNLDPKLTGNCGEWSPDSAYYSSIPNYSSFTISKPQLQQFIVNNNSNNSNIDNIKTHLV